MPVVISGSQGTTIISGSGVASVSGSDGVRTYISSSQSGKVDITGSLTVSGSNTLTSYGPINVSGSPGALFQIDATSGSVPSANAPILFVTGGAVGRVGIGTSAPSKTLSVNGGISGSSTLHAQGVATLASTLAVSGAFTANGGAVFNENSADLDFRVETNGNANTIFAEGSSDYVGIGFGSPKVALDVHHTASSDPETLGNDTGGGEVVYFGSSSAGLLAGALYYLNSAGGWMSASAAATGSGGQNPGGHNQLLGISLGTNPNVGGMLIRGFFDLHTYLSGNFNAGAPVYIASGSAQGKISPDAPSGSHSFVRVVGYCTTASKVIYFNPDATYVEIAEEEG